MPRRDASGRFVKGTASPAPSSGRSGKAKRSYRARRARKNPAVAALVTNPSALSDLTEIILPGFGGYAATKFLARIVYVQLSKRFPTAGRHLAAGSTIASFLAAWLLVHRIKRLEKHHTPIVIGSAIASLQTLVQTYLPKYGWMISDIDRSEAAVALPATTLATTLPAAPIDDVERLFPGGPEVVDDNQTDDDDLGDLGSLGLGSLGSGSGEHDPLLADVN